VDLVAALLCQPPAGVSGPTEDPDDVSVTPSADLPLRSALSRLSSKFAIYKLPMAGPRGNFLTSLLLALLIALSSFLLARACEGECITGITNAFHSNYTVPVRLTFLSLVSYPSMSL